MSQSERLEKLEQLDRLIDSIHASTLQLKTLCQRNQENLISICKRSEQLCSISPDFSPSSSTESSFTSEVEQLRNQLLMKEREIQSLLQERNCCLVEINQLNEDLQILSEDRITLEAELQEKDELQASVYRLSEEIIQRNSIISKLQIENMRIKNESGKLLQEFAQAIEADEELFGSDPK